MTDFEGNKKYILKRLDTIKTEIDKVIRAVEKSTDNDDMIERMEKHNMAWEV